MYENNSGTTSDPKLVVTYSLPSVGATSGLYNAITEILFRVH